MSRSTSRSTESRLGNDEVAALLALSELSGIGEARRQRLLATFGSAREALGAHPSAWASALGLITDVAQRIQSSVDWPRAQAQLAALEALSGRALLRHEAGYPELLGKLAVPPPALFALGPGAAAHPCVALVGTRRPSRSGSTMARRLAGGLAARGFCVVSGMASGIDTAAHEGALAAGGTTIAVLGSGVDVVTPISNRALYKRIQEQGAVVSDLPPGTVATRYTFPRRNRIISGLSLGTVVVEAPRHSGALITARNALDQGRRLFAVPGDVPGGHSAGGHQLLRDGAQLVESADEIVEALRPLLPDGFEPQVVEPDRLAGLSANLSASLSGLEPRQRLILERLRTEPVPVDELAAASALSAAEILDALSRLELAGLVDQLPGKRFCLSETVAER
jgi:DNA processing protein